MGCIHSKKETSDLHPNVFRVVNIDENGIDLCSGQLEITDSDIILYREGRDSTVWPLHSLRRYGFEGEIFSFESGRRCETGEGIYAFRCRRATLLFRTLQQQIQHRNGSHEPVPYPVTRLTPSPQGRQTLQASVVHRSSIDNGPPETAGTVNNNNLQNAQVPTTPARTVTQSPRSPSSVDILEVMPLYPRSQANTNHVTNVYQVSEFKREHNNNQSEVTADTRHVYCNDLNRDLAILRNTLRQETALNTMRDIEDETRFLESRYINETVPNNNQVKTLSPTLSTSSEHYAQLSIEQQQQQQETARLYMNIAPPDKNAAVVDVNKNDATPTTPLTPKQVEYCNLNMGPRPEINTYANLSLGDMADSLKNVKQMLHLEQSHKLSESDTIPSMSPLEDSEVNYAILDIDSKKDSIKMSRELASPESQSYNSSKNESTASCSSQPRGRLVSQSSLDKPPTTTPSIGYTTIDFDKTVALKSVRLKKDRPRKNKLSSSNEKCAMPSGSDSKKTPRSSTK